MSDFIYFLKDCWLVSIPSFYEEGRTVLDETRECNKNWESDSKHCLCEQGFQPP